MPSTPSHTQGEFEILVQGTGSARWPTIIVRPEEPVSPYDYRELGRLESFERSKNSRYIRDDVNGNRWEYDWESIPHVDHDEVAANARLFAGSAKLLAACRQLLADAEACPGAYIHSRSLVGAIQAIVEQIDTPVEFQVEAL